jgi:hypothetical protein
MFIPEGIHVINTPFFDGERRGMVLIVTDGTYEINTEPYFPCAVCGSEERIEELIEEMIANLKDMREHPNDYFGVDEEE